MQTQAPSWQRAALGVEEQAWQSWSSFGQSLTHSLISPSSCALAPLEMAAPHSPPRPHAVMG